MSRSSAVKGTFDNGRAMVNAGAVIRREPRKRDLHPRASRLLISDKLSPSPSCTPQTQPEWSGNGRMGCTVMIRSQMRLPTWSNMRVQVYQYLHQENVLLNTCQHCKHAHTANSQSTVILPYQTMYRECAKMCDRASKGSAHPLGFTSWEMRPK